MPNNQVENWLEVKVYYLLNRPQKYYLKKAKLLVMLPEALLKEVE